LAQELVAHAGFERRMAFSGALPEILGETQGELTAQTVGKLAVEAETEPRDALAVPAPKSH
jgi:hypothetical protein